MPFLHLDNFVNMEAPTEVGVAKKEVVPMGVSKTYINNQFHFLTWLRSIGLAMTIRHPFALLLLLFLLMGIKE